MSHQIAPVPSEEPGDNIANIARAIDLALVEAGKADISETVEIIAISKKHSVASIERALAAGHRSFGENRVQEAQEKWPALKAKYPDVTLHLVGPLQSNKAADAIALFDVIHTIDRMKIAKAVAAESEKQGRLLRSLSQVNTGEEPQKSGIPPQEIEKFISDLKNDLSMKIEGLMCIPPINEPPAPHFALLAKFANRYGLKHLSMGMSSDYEVAAQLGATMVRVGTAVFGKRPEKQGL